MKQLILVITTILILIGCGGKKENAAETDKATEKLQVVTTVGMITDVVKIIAGDQAEVIGLMGEGVDPHLYKASHGDVGLLSKADIIFYNGLHLEGKMGDVLKKMSRARPVIPVSRAIPDSLLRQPPEFAGHHDPHIWMVPKLWSFTLPLIAEELGRAQPKHRSDFRSRADSLGKVIEALHEWATSELATIPERQRVLITAHDAFGYFGQWYQIEVQALQGISTATDYGLADVRNLVTLLVEREIKAVFVESSVPTKPLEAVIEGARARGHDVEIGGTLFSDAMGEAGSAEGSYVGMIRHNVTTIVNALK
jgi:manganese/zinc/iron transport system substrate-binding protein